MTGIAVESGGILGAAVGRWRLLRAAAYSAVLALSCTQAQIEAPSAGGSGNLDPGVTAGNSNGSGSPSGQPGSSSGNGSGTGKGTGSDPGSGVGTGSGSGTGSGTNTGTGGSSNNGQSSSSGGTRSATGGANGQGAPLADCTTPGPRLIRRLTAAQYRNSLVDLFQDSSLPSDDVLTDPAVLRFRVDADAPLVRDLDAELLMNYAEKVADWAVKNHLNAVSSCTSTDQQCRQQFIQNFGLKTHREKLTSAEVAAYEQLFTAESSFQAGATAVITAMLQSPYLLYRRELGQQAGSQFTLGSYELASELAYLLTDSAPDAQLLDAAANNRLATREDLDREANRLLSSNNSRRALGKFVDQWLEIEGATAKAKDTSINLTTSLRSAMIRETEELFFDTFFGNGDISKLFSAKYTFLNKELASFYQLAGPSSDSFQKLDLSSGNRTTGILGHAAFLMTHGLSDNSSPVQRGRAIRERLLCAELPPVPSNLNTNLAGASGFATNRKRYEQHDKDPVCAGCHQVMDPVGFPFEHYDAVGRFRDQENGNAIDASGVLSGMPEGNVPLNGAQTLVDYLAQSENVRACLVRYWTYFAHGRDQWTDKQCNDDFVRREAGQNGYTLKSVLMAILHAPSFTRRVKDQ